MPELSLRTVPGYIVHDLLETDLVSATYLAERESDGFPVVLQAMSEEFDDPVLNAAFLDAYDRVAQIRHPVVPPVYDVGRVDSVLYSVTGAVEGRSLASTLARAGRLSIDATRSVCSELADALDILHAADVVHGALNPYTVWISDRERAPSVPWVTLRGFGTDPLVSQRAALDRVDPPPADLFYVAPEQIRREDVTGRVDQYALACMVVHCLTGAPPFERATVNALVGAHLFAAPRAADGRWDVLEPHVVGAVQRAMAKDPGDRFTLCDAFATAIEADWLPGGSAQPGATERLPPIRAAGTGRRTPTEPLPLFSPSAATRRRLDPQILRWLVILSASIVIVLALLILQARSADQTPTGSQQETREAPEPAVPPPQTRAAWQGSMAASEQSIIGAAGEVVSVMDMATGAPRWRGEPVDGGPLTMQLDGVAEIPSIRRGHHELGPGGCGRVDDDVGGRGSPASSSVHSS